MVSRALSVVLSLVVYSSGLRAQETRFTDANTYNPVPNASGSMIAYVLTGWDRQPGVGGFGRSNLKSLLAFSTKDGRTVASAPMDCFLDRWIDQDAVSCYRDSHFGIASNHGWRLRGSKAFEFRNGRPPTERVTYVATLKTFVWLEDVNGTTVLQTPNGPLGDLGIRITSDDLLIPSPDERYLAIAGNGAELMVYSLATKKSVDLGRVQIHPDGDWGYMKPSWDPWFRDSSRLTLSTGKSIYVSTPDGTDIEEVGNAVQGYLPVPSPDGRSIAYASYVSRPMAVRSDLTFWGGASIWVIGRGQGKGTRVTQPSEDTTLDLRWLDGSTLIFDRMSDRAFPATSASIWVAKVAQK